MKYWQVLLGIVICIVLEFAIYKINHKYTFFQPVFTTTNRSLKDEIRAGGGKFTNPLLECLGVEENDSFEQLNISKPAFTNFVNNLKVKYGLDTISIYLRDLNNGPWIGINESEDFIGGSLLKVPILISFLKKAEDEPKLLDEEFDYKQQLVSNDQYFTSNKQLEIGKKYKASELLEYMVKYSDNNAAYLLFQSLSKNDFDQTFEALGLGDPDPNNPYTVDAKTYAGFFRLLYNASYLEKGSSEKALGLLTQTEFNRGIQAGLPSDVVVAHKFGIRSDGDVNQLHDCGVVYYPSHPYLICIMTKSHGGFDKMASSISDISKFVYDQVSKIGN